MRDLQQYGDLCISYLNAIDIYPNDISEWKINTRAKKRYGQAQFYKGKYSISINVELLNDNCPEKALLSTICHELLHCVNGCMNHGNKWSNLAELVSDCYDLRIQRTSSLVEKYGETYSKIIIEKEKEQKKTFMCKCEDCGKIYKRVGMRAPSWYVHPYRFHCTPCYKKGYNGKLIQIVA